MLEQVASFPAYGVSSSRSQAAMALAHAGSSPLSPAHSSILNLPGESTLRRDFLRLQLANKERSEALRRQQLEQQQRENEEHKRQLLAERQKRIEEQKEQRRRLEEVRTTRSWPCVSVLGLPPRAQVLAPSHPGVGPQPAGSPHTFTAGGRGPKALTSRGLSCLGLWDLGVVASGKQVEASAPSNLTQMSPPQ